MSSEYGPKSGVKELAVKDVERTTYDLSHWSFKVGKLGQLQFLSCVPTVAGQSISLDASIVFRASPLRRNMYLDYVIDLFAFWIPYRHSWTNWADFIKAGVDEGVTLGTDTMTTDAKLHSAALPSARNVALPLWYLYGPVQIWNNYFRDPSDAAGILANDYLTTLADGHATLLYGLPCANIKRIWNAAILSTVATTDYRFALVDTDKIDLYTMASLQGRLKTEQARDFFAISRYRDVLDYTWGTKVNIDADQRPQLLMRSTQWMSGHDVDGTDDATLGTYTGKSVTLANLRFPRKFIPEHGTMWICALVRIPPVHADESHYLIQNPEPTYAEISGDPDIIRRTAPVTLSVDDIFAQGTNAVSLGTTPFAQWYREQPSVTHLNYLIAAGHPFMENTFSTRNEAVYITPTQYDAIFMSTQLGHWNCQGHIAISSQSFIPVPETSIFAGTLG